ncbi:hypothetical protein CLCR_06687 [Cladophialophora carrionii]|uniref:Uncharacterized protein n=1 Tax=Cladophialophora carrionii TaxID=86049 RepID=A0A1C1CM77_9EURO|nr:hypothetical protein CLCR_06687 [Cladophialophora carrionii]
MELVQIQVCGGNAPFSYKPPALCAAGLSPLASHRSSSPPVLDIDTARSARGKATVAADMADKFHSRIEPIIEGTLKFIIHSTGVATECSVCLLAQGESDLFFKGAEHAPVDFGLLAVPHNLAVEAKGPAERTFEALRKYPHLKEFLFGSEFKSCLLLEMDHPTRAICYKVHIKPGQQKHAAAFLVYTVAAPRVVKLIPSWIYDYHFDYRREYTLRESTGSSYQARVEDQAPLPWDFCGVPLGRLAENVQDMAAFCSGQTKSWRNVSNDLEYERCPRPQTCGFHDLIPRTRRAPLGHSPDILLIDAICEKFRAYGVHYEARLMDLAPAIGDFAFVHKQSGAKLVCASGFRLRHKGRTSIRQRYFSAIYPVDVYLVQLEPRSACSGWLFLPRDILPDTWFDGSVDKDDTTLPAWSLDATSLSRYLIAVELDDRDGQPFVARLEEVMNQCASLQTRNLARPFYLPPASSSPDTAPSSRAETTPSSHAGCDGAPRVQRKDIPNEPKDTWSQLVFESMEVGGSTDSVSNCQRCDSHRYSSWADILRGWGKFYPLRTNPMQGCAFSPFMSQSFVQADARTPFVRVHFACITLVDTLLAFTYHDRRALKPAGNKDDRSIFVLAPSSTTGGQTAGTLMEAATVRYVVPSEQLASDFIEEWYGGNTHSDAGKPIPLYLRGGDLIDAYRVPLDQVVWKLLSLCRAGLSQFFGDEQTRAGSTVQTVKYLTTTTEILRHYSTSLQVQASPQAGDRSPPRTKNKGRPPRMCTNCRALKLPRSL